MFNKSPSENIQCRKETQASRATESNNPVVLILEEGRIFVPHPRVRRNGRVTVETNNNSFPSFRLILAIRRDKQIFCLCPRRCRRRRHFPEHSKRLIPGGGIVIVRLRIEFTVRPPHAGTLVAFWTTAHNVYSLKNRKTQLAPFLLLFLALIIGTRCSTSNNNATNIRKPPISTSPTYNSRINSSNIALSTFIQIQFVHNDPIANRLQKIRKLPRRNINHISQKEFIPIRKSSSLDVVGDRSGKTWHQRENRKNNIEDSSEINAIGNFSRVISEKLNYTNPAVIEDPLKRFPGKSAQPMVPASGQADSSLKKWAVVNIVVSSVALTVTLGLITCILSYYRTGSAPEGGGTAASDPNNAALTPTSAPMLSVVSAGATAGVGGMERLRGGRAAARDLAAARERQVRLHALRSDIAVNLPPSITMPDGEDHPYSNARIHIRDAEQEAEIYQKCIRPPPNRTVLESESPPPYRSSSAGLLGSFSASSSSSAEWSTSGGASSAPLVVRCHSMSSSSSSSTTAGKRPEAGTSGQKTDFLQRTVKIFTGKKNAPQAPSPAPTLPVVVVVPTAAAAAASRRRPPEQQNPPAAIHRPHRGGV